MPTWDFSAGYSFVGAGGVTDPDRERGAAVERDPAVEVGAVVAAVSLLSAELRDAVSDEASRTHRSLLIGTSVELLPSI